MTDEPARPEPPVSELLAVRRAKLDRLREQGIDPFPHSFAGVTPIGDILPAWDHLEAGDQRGGLGPAVRLDDRHHDLGATVPATMTLAEHGVGLADAGGHAEKYLDPATVFFSFIVLYLPEQGVRIGPFIFFSHFLTPRALSAMFNSTTLT